jgi:hypothetical protein
MKFTQIHAREKDSPKRNVSKTSDELNIELDKDTRERLLRLRKKLPKTNDSELIALAIRALEEKMGRIIKRKMIRKIRTLKSGGKTRVKNLTIQKEM